MLLSSIVPSMVCVRRPDLDLFNNLILSLGKGPVGVHRKTTP